MQRIVKRAPNCIRDIAFTFGHITERTVNCMYHIKLH